MTHQHYGNNLVYAEQQMADSISLTDSKVLTWVGINKTSCQSKKIHYFGCNSYQVVQSEHRMLRVTAKLLKVS